MLYVPLFTSSELILLCRCDAMPDNLDGPGSHCHTNEKTDFLIKAFDPGILWDDFGIQHDIVVCFYMFLLPFISNH